MKGIILAGGSGTRLWPMTAVMSKQLQPIYDKPMIYYPLSTLMLGGIRDILVISTPHDLPNIEKLLGDGSRFGVKLSYAEQAEPNGIAQAFIIGEKFIGRKPVTLILGDNIFHGPMKWSKYFQGVSGARIFGYPVNDPQRYGIVNFSKSGKVLSLEEKPKKPKSRYAIPGLYVYDNSVVEKAKSLEPSERGELEITDINRKYLEEGKLTVERFGRGMAWLDTGTPESLLEAALFVSSMENRQAMKIGCPEEIAFTKGWITKEQLLNDLEGYGSGDYVQYLKNLVDEQT